jgi:hypothetical protein
MILSPEVILEAEDAGEEAVWATLRKRLEVAGKGDAALYLRHHMKLEPDEELRCGRYIQRRYGMYQRVSEYSASFNAVTGAQMSWFFDLLRENSEDGLNEAACMAIAREVAKPPDDAVVETAVFEKHDGASVFIARWSHIHEGIPVENDFIQVLVNPKSGRAFAHHRKWHGVDLTAKER